MMRSLPLMSASVLAIAAAACAPVPEEVAPEVMPTLATATVLNETDDSTSSASTSSASTSSASTSSENAEAAQASPAFQTSADPSQPATFTYQGELTQGGWLRGLAPAGATSVSLNGTAVRLAADGQFFAAFDRDAGGSAQLTAQLRDGRTVAKDLTISPRAWKIERVNVARRSGGPSAAFMNRRRPELAQIGAARRVNAPSEGWKQDFIWPVKGRISGRFGSQRIYRGEPGSYHGGIDIAPGNGVPFVAPADGVVTLATPRPFSLEGYLLIIDHGNGLNSAFLHCSKISVSEGEVVKQGQYIGNIGSTGRATGPHLHWGLKWNAARLDPLLFVGPM